MKVLFTNQNRRKSDPGSGHSIAVAAEPKGNKEQMGRKSGPGSGHSIAVAAEPKRNREQKGRKSGPGSGHSIAVAAEPKGNREQKGRKSDPGSGHSISVAAEPKRSKEQMGEEALHTSRVHVFHIDPSSKKSWIPASQQSVDVSVYRDKARKLYRIISLDGDKVLINSTLTPDLIFSKTSQKFGQWTDSADNKTYGLGFSSEAELNEFVQQFDNMKSMFEIEPANNNGDREIPGVQRADQLRYENDRLKIALAQSSSNAKKWETELHNLRNTNDRLTAAIQESSANVDKWNMQLSALKEENARLKLKVMEMEKTTGTCGSLEMQLKDVIGRLSQAERLLSEKDKELVELKMRIDNLQQVDVINKRTKVQCQMAEEENAKLKEDILDLHDKLQHLNLFKDTQAQELRSLQSRFNSKMAELMDINEKISDLV